MTTTQALDDFKARFRRMYGEKADFTEVDAVRPEISHHYHGARIEVVRTYPSGETFTRRGRVSATIGWRPALLLVHRVSDMGSSDVLGPEDRLVKVVSK